MATFYKYQGAGNDFILVDNRDGWFKSSEQYVSLLCNRRFGIGADGLMLLENDKMADFNMVFFNSDGKEGTMCGNGGRCIVAFAKHLGIIDSYTKFNSPDGIHEAFVSHKDSYKTTVKLKMSDVDSVTIGNGYYFLNTGSPHYVQLIKNLANFDIVSEGRKIRHDKRFSPNGTNVNFIEPTTHGKLLIGTFERGVEDETLACGTGAVAAAIAYSIDSGKAQPEYRLQAKGGELCISFDNVAEGKYKNIWLEGPANFVFKGELPNAI